MESRETYNVFIVFPGRVIPCNAEYAQDFESQKIE